MPTPRLTEQQMLEAISAINAAGGDARIAAKNLGMNDKTLWGRYVKAQQRLNITPDAILSKPENNFPVEYTTPKAERTPHNLNAKRYLITSAQNATPVSEPFFDAMKAYCREHNAELLVIPYRYRNPTSIWTDKDESQDFWAASVEPYLLDTKIELHPELVVLGDIKTQPTASRPLSGFQTLTGGQSAIIGHPKLELETVPTPQHKLPKILSTTGACTVANYGEGKAGSIGVHHHTLGAALVEIDGDAFHLRQINASMDGSFYDLTSYYSADRIEHNIGVAALVMGDTHVEVIDPNVVSATFEGNLSMAYRLKPQYLVWHDVIDQYARNHHHKGDPFIAYAKHTSKIRNNVEQDLRSAYEFIDSHSPSTCVNVFVPSNHVDALKRWVKENAQDPTKDPENLVFWAKTFTKMLEGTKMTPTGASVPDPFIMWAKEWMSSAHRSVFPARDESFQICGIEVGYHGDAGPNGAKGSRNSFGKIGVKTIIGHSHSPGIRDGVYQVGTSSRYDLEYASGPSSWLHSHCIIYPNGKRSLVNIIGKKWRLV